MKPTTWRSSSFGCLFISLASTSVYAGDIFWDGTANPGSWTNAANWSTTNSAAGVDPTLAPGSGDVAVFTVNGITTAQSINLDGDQSVLGIRTSAQTALSTILGGGTDRTLSIGASGISHPSGTNGALAIGSNTAGQKVNISLLDSQTWNSSVTGGTTGAVAIKIYNGVSLRVAGAKTLTLDGTNTGTDIFGSISDGSGTLSLTKNGSSVSVWNLSGTNTYTGLTTINGGTLRYSGLNSFAGLSTPGGTVVNNGGTIDLRAAFASVDLDSIVTNTTFNNGSNLIIDTTSASRTISAGITGGQNFTKQGVNTLTLSGSNNYSGKTNITGGTLFVQTSSSLPGFSSSGNISVSGGAVLQIRNGGATGFSNSQVSSLLANTTFASATTFAVDNINADFDYSGVISGNIRFTTAGSNNNILFGLNTYDGATTLGGGKTIVRSIGSVGGGASNFGAPTTATNGQINVGSGGTTARLTYLGAENATDRTLRFNGTTGGAFIEASGTGALSFSNTSGTTDGSRTIVLTGYNKDNNTISGAINNYGSGTTTVNKRGSGTWVLSGNNAFTGTLQTTGGKLIIDHTGGNDPLSGTVGLTMIGGNVQFKGAAGGTNDTTAGVITVSNSTSNRITVDQSAGGSSSWTYGALNGTNSSGGTPGPLYLDRSSGANLIVGTIAASSSVANAFRIANGLVMVSGGTAGTSNFRAMNFVTDSTATGFMTQNGSNELVRYTAYNNASSAADDILGNHAGDASNGFTNTSNILMNSSASRSSALSFSTLLMDTSAGNVTLSMGSSSFSSSAANGRTVLVNGDNDATITASSGTIASSTYFANSGTGKLKLDLALGASSVLITAGPGLIEFNRTVNSDLYLNGNTLQLTGTQNYSAVGNLRINEGMLEIGADLDNDPGSDFNRRIHTGTNMTTLTGDSGFSALGADRTVNLGLTTAGDGDTMTWGAGAFLVTNNSTRLDGEHTFKLGSATSTHTLNFQNAIDFNGLTRNIDVADGTSSTNTDARLNGALTNGGLIKTGAGTLELTAANTYTGVTELRGGKTILSGSINATTAITVNGATLQLGAANALNDFAAMTLENATLETAGFSDTLGVLTIHGSNVLDLGTAASIVNFADSSTAVWGSTLSILNWTGNILGGGTDQVFFGNTASGLTGTQLSSISFVDPTGYSSGTYAASMLSTGEIVPIVIPEVSQSLLAALGSALLIFRRRRA